MATSNTPPSLAKSLASLVQSQLAQLHNNPALPSYDYSNLDSSVIDPEKYAQGSANSAWNPQIDAAQHQIDLNPGQTKLDQSNISDWYAHALKTYNAGAANASHQYDNAQSQLGDSAQGFMAALGGSANSANQGIANQALIAQAMLAGNRNADVNLDTNMQGLIPLAESQAHVNEQGRMGKQLDDLRAQLGSLKGAKGAAYQAALQDATGKKFDQLSAIDQAKFGAAQSIFGDQVSRRDSNTSTASSIMNGLITSMLAPGQITAQNLSNKLTGANIKGVNAKTKLIANPGINLKNPGDVNKFDGIMRAAITRTITDPNTGDKKTLLNGDPRKAWTNMMGVLKRYGVTGADGITFARGVLRDYLPKGWSIGANGKLHGPNDWVGKGPGSSESTVRAGAKQALVDAVKKKKTSNTHPPLGAPHR